MSQLVLDTLPELIATLVGVAIGGIGALFANRYAESRRKRKRAQLVLRNIVQELIDSYDSMTAALPSFDSSNGVSFYISTTAWDTAVASGDLPEIIGFELADLIENQYSMLLHLRYYLQLRLSLLTAAESSVEIRTSKEAARRAIVKGLTAAIKHHPLVMAEVEIAQAKMRT